MLRQFAGQLVRVVERQLSTTRAIATTSHLSKEKDATDAGAEPEKKYIRMEKDKNITLIGIDRPQQRNAIHARAAAQLCQAFNTFEEDTSSPVAVLYGVGGSFCAGYDILAMATDGREEVSLDMLMTQEGSVGPTRRHLKKPVICSINGYCVANGLELALMCDLRVMEESAVLGFFNRRFGVPVIDGGTARLPAMIGISRALDLILTGRQVDAQEAQQMGIANRVVRTGTGLAKAVELAKALAKFPQSALLHDRMSLYSAVFEAANFSQAVQNEIMYTSKDMIEQMQEGIKWFNKTFKSDRAQSWLKRDMSMVDWDDAIVAEAAAQKEEQKRAEETARLEAEKKQKEEQNKKKEPEPEQKSAEQNKAK